VAAECIKDTKPWKTIINAMPAGQDRLGKEENVKADNCARV